jgi:3-oxoacyl-[acyl-carrier protein] reductase
MELNIKNKVSVILAGSSGIGKGVAMALAREGSRIAICSRSLEKLNVAAKEIEQYSGNKPFTYQADVSNKNELEIFLENVIDVYKEINILVNNAGGPPAGGIKTLAEIDYENAHQLTLLSAIRATRFVVPIMEKKEFGRIFFLSSTGIKSAVDGLLLSNTYRSALAGFAKTIASEVSQKGVRIHTLLSGPFNTARVKELGQAAAESKGISFKKWKQEAEKGTMLGRFGDPIEMGNLVAFLSSDLSSYMTGTTIAVDGGALKTIT